MATNQQTSIPVNRFQLYDRVAMEIENVFNPLIEQLIARRNTLLTQLQIIKEDFVTKETTRKSAIEELEKVIRQKLEESIRVNTNFSVQRKAIEVFREKLEQYQTPTKLPQPFFYCPTLSYLQPQIAEFGEVRESELDYSLKKQPVLSVGRKGKANNELDNPKGLALDETNQLIYIADCDNGRIQVVSFAGKFLKRFGQGVLKWPWGISVGQDHVFVTDINLHALFQFCKKDYKLVRRTAAKEREAQLYYPRGLCVDYNGDVYVAACGNGRISVFSQDLQFLQHLGTQQLNYPCDVKVTSTNVVVLDSNSKCIHFLSRSGALLSSSVTHGENGMVHDPWFFCFDTAGNILISDYIRHNIKILSPSGQLIHTIGKYGQGRGELFAPQGICISQLLNIFVISYTNHFYLQSF